VQVRVLFWAQRKLQIAAFFILYMLRHSYSLQDYIYFLTD
jgi:hypothetical protein